MLGGSQGQQSATVMEISNELPPPTEVSHLTGYKIPHVIPGQPRNDPRAAMRPTALPRTPPKTFQSEGEASRKRNRKNSRTPGSSEQHAAAAKEDKPTPKGGEFNEA